MFLRPRFLALVLVPLMAAPALAAPPGVLDLIPADAAGALAFRDVNDLGKKGDVFLKEAEWTLPWRPSQLVDLALGWLGLQGEVDTSKPILLVGANPERAGMKNDQPSDRMLVLVLPYKDRDRIAAKLGVKQGTVEEGKILPVKLMNGGTLSKGYFSNGYVYLGIEEKAVQAVVTGKRLAGALTPQRRKQLDQADILLQLGAKAWGDYWGRSLDGLEKTLASEVAGPEKETAGQLMQALRQVRYGIMAVRVDRGLGFNFLSVFDDDKNQSVQKLLTTFQGGPGASDLKGLPEGNVLFVEGARGNGEQNVVLARLLIRFMLRNIVWTEQMIAVADQPKLVNITSMLWKQLRGNRLGVYFTSDERKLGLVSVVAILDPANPAQMLGEILQLARLGDPSSLKLGADNGKKEDIAVVEKLIRDLGNDEFEIREVASARLQLIGEPALPYLEKALKSDDPEVVRRASDLKDFIDRAGTQRRKDLLAGTFKYRLRPSFTFYPGAEKRGDTSVNILEMKIDQKDRDVIQELQGLLGPSWDKIRVAVVGKQVVVLLGSDVSLFDRAIKNVKEGLPGLAASPHLAASRKHIDPSHKLEAHVSLQKGAVMMSSWNPTWRLDLKPGPELSSFALMVEPDRLQLDVWIPAKECRPIIRYNGW